MATQTPRKALTKPELNDYVSLKDHFNDNWDKIDDMTCYNNNEHVTGTWKFDSGKLKLVGGHELALNVAGTTTNSSLTFSMTGTKTITLQGSPVLDDWFNQNVKSTASPTFVNLTLTGLANGILKATGGTISGGNTVFIASETDLSASDPILLSVNNLQLKYDTSDFQLSFGNLQIKDSGINHGGLSGLSNDDHTQYLLADGTRELTADWDIGSGRKIFAENISARYNGGLSLTENGGKGIIIQNSTGYVGINKSNPSYTLDVNGDIYASGDIYLGGSWKKALTASEGTKEIYVATTGNDETGDGTASKPYRTIAKAVLVLPRGVTEHTYINISPGTYDLDVDGYIDTTGIDVWASLTFRAKNTDGYELYPSSPLQANIYSSTTIGRTTLNLQPNSLVGGRVWIMNGKGSTQYRTIVSNTATTITVDTVWDTIPDSTSYFVYCGGVSIQGSSSSLPLINLVRGAIHLRGLILRSTGYYAVFASSVPSCSIFYCFFNESRYGVVTLYNNTVSFSYDYMLQSSYSFSGLVVQSEAGVYIYGSVFNGQSTSYNTAGLYAHNPSTFYLPIAGLARRTTFTNLRYGVYAPDFVILMNKDVNVTFTNVTTPYYMGKGDFRTALISDDSSNVTLEIKNNSPTSDYDQQIKFTKANTTSFTLGVDDSDSDRFKISAGGVLGTNDSLVIDASGNVGIGINPDDKLHIEGGNVTLGTDGAGSGAKLKMYDTSGTTDNMLYFSNIAPSGFGGGILLTFPWNTNKYAAFSLYGKGTASTIQQSSLAIGSGVDGGNAFTIIDQLTLSAEYDSSTEQKYFAIYNQAYPAGRIPFRNIIVGARVLSSHALTKYSEWDTSGNFYVYNPLSSSNNYLKFYATLGKTYIASAGDSLDSGLFLNSVPRLPIYISPKSSIVLREDFDEYRGMNLLTDGELDIWTSDTNLTYWTEENVSAGVRDITKESSDVFSGNFSCKLTATSNDGSTDFGIYQDITTENNSMYELLVYYKNSTGSGKIYIEAYNLAGSVVLSSASISEVIDAWLPITIRFTSTGTTSVRIKIYYADATTGVCYIDRVIVQKCISTTMYDGTGYLGTIGGCAVDKTGFNGEPCLAINRELADSFVSYAVDSDARPSAWTAEFWFRGSDASPSYSGIFGWGGGATPAFYISYGSSKRPLLYLGGGNFRSFSTNIPNNPCDENWHHIVITCPGSGRTDINNAQMYIDGVLQAVVSTVFTSEQSAKTGNFYIGCALTTSEGYGQIAGFKLYNRVLTRNEIVANYLRSACATSATINEKQVNIITSGNLNTQFVEKRQIYQTNIIKTQKLVTGIVNNTATTVLTIRTTNEAGNNDGGAYVCNIRALIGHGVVHNASNTACRNYHISFARAMSGSGSGANSAVTEIYESNSAGTNPSERDISSISASLNNPNAYTTNIQFTISLSGSSITSASAVLEAEIIWQGFLTAPIIE